MTIEITIILLIIVMVANVVCTSYIYEVTDKSLKELDKVCHHVELLCKEIKKIVKETKYFSLL